MPLERFAGVSARTPLLLDLKPAGKYVMEDFHRAGGMSALLNRARDFLRLEARTVMGGCLGDDIPESARVYDDAVIRPLSDPLQAGGALAVLRGSLAPDGCVIKGGGGFARVAAARGGGGGFRRHGGFEGAH